jgi:hypothetical protein
MIDSKKIKFIYLKNYLKSRPDYPLPSYIHDNETLCKYKYDSFNVGYSVASTLACELDRTPFEKWRKEVSLLSSEAIHLYKCIQSIIADYNITSGYIINARFSFFCAFF